VLALARESALECDECPFEQGEVHGGGSEFFLEFSALPCVLQEVFIQQHQFAFEEVQDVLYEFASGLLSRHHLGDPALDVVLLLCTALKLDQLVSVGLFMLLKLGEIHVARAFLFNVVHRRAVLVEFIDEIDQCELREFVLTQRLELEGVICSLLGQLCVVRVHNEADEPLVLQAYEREEGGSLAEGLEFFLGVRAIVNERAWLRREQDVTQEYCVEAAQLRALQVLTRK